MDQEWYLKRNFKILWSKWKWNTNYQNSWDAAKAVIREKCIALNVYSVKEESSKINNICFHFRKLEETAEEGGGREARGEQKERGGGGERKGEGEGEVEDSRRKEIIITRAEINKIENRKS